MQPNIIIVMCDQMRACEVGCYGHPTIRTPNIDAMASQGVRFEHAVTNSPLCAPARSCLLTGQYARTCTGTVDNIAAEPPSMSRERLRDTTLAEALRLQGYRTGLIGKWHIDPDPSLVGFDCQLRPLWMHLNSGQTYFESSPGSALAGPGKVCEGFGADLELRKARQFMHEHADGPFFLYYNIALPHMPLADMPSRYRDLYRPQDVTLRPNVYVDGQPARNDNWFKIYLGDEHLAKKFLWEYPYYRQRQLRTENLPEGFDLRNLVALYDGGVTYVDDMVGQLMQSLRDEGLDRDTLVVFTSDHGDNLGSHNCWNKQTLFDEVLRVPLVVHWPSQLRPLEVGVQQASLVDVAPTLLELCGLQAPATMQGRSLASVVQGRRDVLEENFAYVETPFSDMGVPRIGIRTPTHTLGIKMSRDCHEVVDTNDQLYDRTSDPYELRNLVPPGEQQELADELRQRLLDWHGRTPWLAT